MRSKRKVYKGGYPILYGLAGLIALAALFGLSKKKDKGTSGQGVAADSESKDSGSEDSGSEDSGSEDSKSEDGGEGTAKQSPEDELVGTEEEEDDTSAAAAALSHAAAEGKADAKAKAETKAKEAEKKATEAKAKAKTKAAEKKAKVAPSPEDELEGTEEEDGMGEGLKERISEEDVGEWKTKLQDRVDELRALKHSSLNGVIGDLEEIRDEFISNTDPTWQVEGAELLRVWTQAQEEEEKVNKIIEDENKKKKKEKAGKGKKGKKKKKGAKGDCVCGKKYPYCHTIDGYCWTKRPSRKGATKNRGFKGCGSDKYGSSCGYDGPKSK